MATWLSEYKNLKNEMEKQIGAGHASLEQLMLYQELLYRIEVLYASQAFCQTAPVTTDVAVLSGHYQLVDAYIQCLTKERRLGQPADQNLKAKRQTASETLDKVVLDCRKRFQLHPNRSEPVAQGSKKSDQHRFTGLAEAAQHLHQHQQIRGGLYHELEQLECQNSYAGKAGQHPQGGGL